MTRRIDRRVSRSFDATRRAIVALIGSLALTPLAHGSEFPVKPVRIVVPFPPGGATDAVTRVLAQRLGAQTGQQFIVENRGGAGGLIGSEIVARAAPDGYTLVMATTGTHPINAGLYSKLPYDPIRDFTAVTRAALLPNLIVVHPSVPARSVRELIALAKKRPGELTYASSGSALYLSGALFTSMADIRMLHVPYKGGGASMPALLAGEVASSFATVLSSLPHVKAGKLRGLAVTSAQRSAAAPDFPTVAESGLPGYEAVAWYGLMGPANLAREALARLNSEAGRALGLREVRDVLLAQGAEPVFDAPDAFGRIVRADLAKWGEVIRKVGAKVD